MGIFNRIFWCSLWLFGGLSAGLNASAQSVTFDVINGDFEDTCGVYNNDIDSGWNGLENNNGTVCQLSPNWRAVTLSGFNGTRSLRANTKTPTAIFSDDIVISSVLGPAQVQGAQIELSYEQYGDTATRTGNTAYIKMEYFDSNGAKFGECTTGNIDPDGPARNNEAPWLYLDCTLPTDETLDYIVIKAQCNYPPPNDEATTCGFALDNVGPVVVTPPSEGSGGGGGGDTIVNVDLDTPVTVDSQDITNAIAAAQNLQAAICSNIPTLDGFGFVPDAWGGAGFGGQIASISQQAKDLCFQETQTDSAVATVDALTAPAPYVLLPSSQAYNDPMAPAVGERWETFTRNFDTGQDLVSATVRNTEMQRAAASYQIAQIERVFGSGTRPNYQTEGGGKYTQSIIDNEPNIEFVEGGYSQTYGRLNELIDQDQLVPDFSSRVELAPPVAAVTGLGSCMATTVPYPSGESLEWAISTLRWNAAQQLADTDIGEFMCGIIDQDISVPSSICLGQPNTLRVAGYTVIEAKPLCIYGSSAQPWWAYVWLVLPNVLMLIAGVAVFKLFF